MALRFFAGEPEIVIDEKDLSLNNIVKNNHEAMQISRDDVKGW